MSEARALSVTEAMTRARQALEGIRLTVVGEVSEFSDKPGYKAAYFTVSDEGASMPSLMWRDAYEASGVALRCGMLVEATGYFSAYVPKGRMQFVVRSLRPAGEGSLRLQVARLAGRLEAEGLMREDRKRRLPPFPERIALVTSPRGKAVHDVIRTLRRRYPVAELLIAGVAVEGERAPAEIVRGIQAACAAAPDVILLVRGGGSYEDLMPFNSEDVARAIVGATCPVVTGIGHEPDTCIADMVADVRASTPTAAAEAASPSCEEVAALLAKERRLLGRALAHAVDVASQRVSRLADRPVLRDPRSLLVPAAQAVDFASSSLRRALPDRLSRDQQRLDRARVALTRLGARITERHEAAIRLAAARLDDLSPVAILGRGYAVCFEADGHTVVRSVHGIAPGDDIVVRLGEGVLGATVNKTEE